MKKSRFTEEQVVGIPKEQEAGVPVAELCRKHGMSDASFYNCKAKPEREGLETQCWIIYNHKQCKHYPENRPGQNEIEMNPELDELIQKIGQEASELCADRGGKVLLYAKVESGVISSDLFYLKKEGYVQFLFSSQDLFEDVYRFWELWQREPGNKEWRTMAYVITGDKLDIDFIYPDQFTEDEFDKRRDDVVREHFGNLEVDYPQPENH